MAEISSLLGLITDDNTRQALIAQMENMFDNAPDEERLIQEIGNPTKVAVALIRYADSGKITPAAAPVVAPAAGAAQARAAAAPACRAVPPCRCSRRADSRLGDVVSGHPGGAGRRARARRSVLV